MRCKPKPVQKQYDRLHRVKKGIDLAIWWKRNSSVQCAFTEEFYFETEMKIMWYNKGHPRGLPNMSPSKPTQKRMDEEREMEKENKHKNSLSDAQIRRCASKWTGMLQSRFNSKRHIRIKVTLTRSPSPYIFLYLYFCSVFNFKVHYKYGCSSTIQM